MWEDALKVRLTFLELLDKVLAYKKDSQLAEKNAKALLTKATSAAHHL